MNRATKKTQDLVNQIELLLKAQKQSIKAGNLNTFEQLAEQLGELISELTANEGYPSKQQKEKLQHIYEDICMAIETEKASMKKDIMRVKGNRKLVKAYNQR